MSIFSMGVSIARLTARALPALLACALGPPPFLPVDGVLPRRGDRGRAPTNFMPESGEARAWDVALLLRSAVQWVLV